MIMKGDMQMRGYYNLPEITAETIVDGYLYTGDLAYKTDDGFIYMLGRADDIINVGGEKVSPIEVENVASLYEDIRECACIGGADPDGIFGQMPILYVVPEKADFDEKKANEFLAKQLEQYKLPKKYVIVDELPRNAMKKIDRKKLKKMWESGESTVERNQVVSAIYGRRSVRNFTDKHIPREILEQIVDCGRQAPSGHNMQTWHFAVITNQYGIQDLKELIEPVAKRRGVYFYGFNNPDALILVSNDVRNQDGIQDSSCAAQNIMLAAHSYGIGSVWINALMRLCDEPEIRPVLTSYGIPENHNVWAMIALGYPANQPNALAKKDNVVSWVE
jgi:long-chain acyl-CoA synthetase